METKQNTKLIISKDKLLESGLHYGHQTKSWNPAMKPFIAMSRRGIHIIDLGKSIKSMENAYNVARRIAERGGTFLFVGTLPKSSQTVRENAERVGAFYIDHRWLGGLLTNFRTIQNSISKLRNLERLEKNGFKGYTKKEAIELKKTLTKLQRSLGGIKYMRRLPQAVFVASIRNETIAIKEAKKQRIPVFGIADSNVDPFEVNFPIFGNDDANRAVALVTTVIADAIAVAKGDKPLAAYLPDDQVKLMGVEQFETQRPRDGKPAYKRDDKFKKTTEVKKPVVEKKEEVKKEEVKPEPVKEVKPEPVKEVKVVNEKEEIEKTRVAIMSKIKSSEDIDKISLTELFGVGPATEKWLTTNKYETITKLSQASKDDFDEETLKSLRLPGFNSIDEKRARVGMFIEESKIIVENIQKGSEG